VKEYLVSSVIRHSRYVFVSDRDHRALYIISLSSAAAAFVHDFTATKHATLLFAAGTVTGKTWKGHRP
jgi:hypothetical protein